MANLIRWGRPSMLSLQRDVEDVFEEYAMPRSIFLQMNRLFDELESPRPVWRELERMLDDVDSPPAMGTRLARLFEDFIGTPLRMGIGVGTRGRMTFAPQVDLTEQEGEYVMKADLPGMREQDIDLKLSDDNVLTISGERREEKNKKVKGYDYSERSYGTFTRSVALPSGIDGSKIQADFRNGVLEIHIPRTEASRPRRIQLSHVDEPRVIAPGNGNEVNAQGAKVQQQPRGS